MTLSRLKGGPGSVPEALCGITCNFLSKED